MATYYLVNTVTVGTTKHFPGEYIDSAQHDTAAIETAGGLLWPSSDATVASAATKAQQMKLLGRNESELESIMQSAVQSSQKSSDASQDTLGASVVKTMVLAVTQAQIAAKGAVTSGTFDSAAFPAGARILGVESKVTTKVQNVGDTDTTTYALGTDTGGESAVFVAASAATTAGTLGGDKGNGLDVGGKKLRMTLTSDVNFDTLTAGAFTITATYAVPAA